MSKCKRAICILVATVMLLAVTSCGTPVEKMGEKAETSMFIEVETTTFWKVVYHRDSGVMYVVSERGQGSGEFTMLVNSDGTPMIYGGGNDNN